MFHGKCPAKANMGFTKAIISVTFCYKIKEIQRVILSPLLNRYIRRDRRSY